jgi:mannose-6-phosphate isomerase-like protein (cupin superfamily)
MQIIARHAVSATQAPDGALVRELASPHNSGLTRHSLAEITHPPGTVSDEHHHLEAEEVYYVLQGEGQVRIDGQARAISPGDVVVILPGQRHQVWQRGEDDLVMLVTCVPAYSIEDVVFAD